MGGCWAFATNECILYDQTASETSTNVNITNKFLELPLLKMRLHEQIFLELSARSVSKPAAESVIAHSFKRADG